MEFPYSQSKDSLTGIKNIFIEKMNTLDGFSDESDPEFIKLECALTLKALFDYLPIVGFILRSTNVRNAFEVYSPMLRLARALIEPKTTFETCNTNLILSSEWVYAPFVYQDIEGLKGFVLIGLPAPESENPLLIPLAGHELGHPLWRKKNLIEEFRVEIVEIIKELVKNTKWKEFQRLFPGMISEQKDVSADLFTLEVWGPALPWAEKQAEESFCDFVGLYLFGISYLHAFAYLTSPGTATPRSEGYPNKTSRIKNLLKAANKYKLRIPEGYDDYFVKDEVSEVSEKDKFRLSLADEALEAIVEPLIDQVKIIISETEFERSTEEEAEIQVILERFKQVVPAENCKKLADIINAAWVVFNDDGFWKGIPQIYDRREETLKELVLKNIEIFEIEQIRKNKHDP